MRYLILLFAGLLFVQISVGQTTGRFNRYVPVPSEPSRRLSYYVPTSYNPANKYKLVIALHGLGDNSMNYRNFLAADSIYAGSPTMITDPHSQLYNAIVVAPESGNNINTDYWTPVSDTCIITLAMADAMSAYHIDSDNVYLNGFSLGGRSALRYGLLNYNRFKALILWTPAIQSVNEANNQTSFTYVWQNSQYIPIYISVGTTDGYLQILQVAYQNMWDDKAIIEIEPIYGMGHSPPLLVDQDHGVDFVNSNAVSYLNNDAGISGVSSPASEECSTSFLPVVSIQNKGVNNLTSATINYQIDNGTVNTYNWTGSLIQLGKGSVTLPMQTVSTGVHKFRAYTSMPNGVTDPNPSNDTTTVSFNSLTDGMSSGSATVEGFEEASFPPANWTFSGTDSAWSWQVERNDTSMSWGLFSRGLSGGYKRSSSCIYFDNFFVNTTGKHYSIRTPEYDFTNATAPALTYDYAYAPVNVQGTLYSDTLAVYYSLDCGSTWNMLLKKGGIALSTIGGADSLLLIPDSNQWKTEAINLAPVIGHSKVMFSFENISGFGNVLYLDNINVNAIQGINSVHENADICAAYPNPNNGEFRLKYQLPANTSSKIEIMDAMGREVYVTDITGEQGVKEINAGFLSPGVYYWRVMADEQVVGYDKVVIVK